MRLQVRERAEIKMSNGGLSDQLCVVVATIIGLLVGSPMFQRIYATTEFQDFSVSRQLRRNLAVSKYRNNTHWLPNYVWKPPEKFHGIRKKPAWEIDEVSESEADKNKRKEYEEWENKMREVTRREREKWQNYEAEKTSKAFNELSTPLANIQEHSTNTSKSKESLDDKMNTQIDPSIELTHNVQNGRWGMSVANPAAEGFFKDSPKTSDSMSMRRYFQQSTVSPEAPDVPMKFPFKVSRTSKVQRSNGPLKLQDDQSTEDHWTDRKEPIISGSLGKFTEDHLSFRQSNDLGRSIVSSNFVKQRKASTTFPNNHRAVRKEKPTKEYLKEMSRRTDKSPSSVWKRYENRRPSGSEKIHGDDEDRGNRRNTLTGRASKKLGNGFTNGRWGMSASLSSREFLREIPGRKRFYKLRTSDQFTRDTIATNNPRSRELTFPRMSEISKPLIRSSELYAGLSVGNFELRPQNHLLLLFKRNGPTKCKER